jgi:hypothetical protein
MACVQSQKLTETESSDTGLAEGSIEVVSPSNPTKSPASDPASSRSPVAGGIDENASLTTEKVLSRSPNSQVSESVEKGLENNLIAAVGRVLVTASSLLAEEANNTALVNAIVM